MGRRGLGLCRQGRPRHDTTACARASSRKSSSTPWRRRTRCLAIRPRSRGSSTRAARASGGREELCRRSRQERRPAVPGRHAPVQGGGEPRHDARRRRPSRRALRADPVSADDPRGLGRPVVIVPPQINKFYSLDLSPEKSLIRFLLSQGLQVFCISWRNPTKEHQDWGLGNYVDSVAGAVEAARKITGSEDVSMMGACSGGITACAYAAREAGAGVSAGQDPHAPRLRARSLHGGGHAARIADHPLHTGGRAQAFAPEGPAGRPRAAARVRLDAA